MGRNFRDKQALQMFPEPDVSAFFVRASQTAVTSCIGRKNRDEPSQEVFASQGLLLATSRRIRTDPSKRIAVQLFRMLAPFGFNCHWVQSEPGHQASFRSRPHDMGTGSGSDVWPHEPVEALGYSEAPRFSIALKPAPRSNSCSSAGSKRLSQGSPRAAALSAVAIMLARCILIK